MMKPVLHHAFLGFAGCAVLALGLIACSSTNDNDGKGGSDGANCGSTAVRLGLITNPDGGCEDVVMDIGCNVSALENGSGYKVICRGDSVGVLLNGKNGENGENGAPGEAGSAGEPGKSCTVASLTSGDGYKVLCGGDSVGVLLNGTAGSACTLTKTQKGVVVNCDGEEAEIQNGTDGAKGSSCTARTVARNGKEGVEVSCDDQVVGTIWNGEDGSSCVTTDNGKGTVTVKCGDATPVTLYKALCGDDPYSPEDKFCVLGKLYDKCGPSGATYHVNTEHCEDGNVVPNCWECKKNRDGSFTYVAYRAPASDEFCWNNFVVKKCGGEIYGRNEYCGKANNGTRDSVRAYCVSDSTLDVIFGDLEASLPSTGNNGNSILSTLLGDFIGEEPGHYTEVATKTFYAELSASQYCSSNQQENLCGTTTYDPAKKFCDIRDNKLYKYNRIDNLNWMTENLAFEYKLPSSVGHGFVNYENNAYENFEAEEGRYYTWNSAVGTGDMRRDAGIDTLFLAAKDEVYGACPRGWRLPAKDELASLSDYANRAAAGGFADLDNTEQVLSFNVNFLGYYDANSVVGSGKAYFWSGTGDSGDDDRAWGLVIKDNDHSSVDLTQKAYAFTIRCVQEISAP